MVGVRVEVGVEVRVRVQMDKNSLEGNAGQQTSVQGIVGCRRQASSIARWALGSSVVATTCNTSVLISTLR